MNERNNAGKNMMIKRLRENGFRVTKQRELLIEMIADDGCSCCKELYYKASKKMPEIGMATVYRTLNALEDSEVIKRENSYQIFL